MHHSRLHDTITTAFAGVKELFGEAPNHSKVALICASTSLHYEVGLLLVFSDMYQLRVEMVMSETIVHDE